jgi:hypothetical protein
LIVCTKCGFENEDADTFCGSCAGFLEWSGERVHEPVVEPEPEPEVEPEEVHAGFIDRVKDAIGIGEKADDETVVATAETTAPETNGASAPHAEPASVAAGPAPAPAGPAPVSTPAAPAAVVSAPVGGSTAGPSTAAPAASVGPSTAAPAATVGPTITPTNTPAPPTSSPVAPAASAPQTAKASTVSPPLAPAQPSTATPMAPTATVTKPEPVQPAAVQPSAVQPQAVKPQAVKARPTTKAKAPSTRVINPGDLVCGQCGEGNDPARKFCRRCGASLQEAVIFNLPWYRKLWRALTRKRVRTAGDRPKIRRRLFGGSGPGLVWSVLRALIAIAIVVLVILAFVGPWHTSIHHRASRYYHDIVGAVHPNYTPVHPDGASSTNHQQGFPPTATIDGATNTHWETTAANNGIGTTLTLRLATPTRIDKIGFIDGDQDGPTTFLAEPVPEAIRVVYNQLLSETVKGKATTHVVPLIKNLTLKDVTSFQTFTVTAKDVTSIEITIDSVYPPSQGSAHNTSLAEVELFTKS